jgi:hypothetical protein
MPDNITETTEEHGEMEVKIKDGRTVKVKATTKYTHWQSGRKDCAITIEEPINSVSNSQ